jgi:hypothetical protein
VVQGNTNVTVEPYFQGMCIYIYMKCEYKKLVD